MKVRLRVLLDNPEDSPTLAWVWVVRSGTGSGRHTAVERPRMYFQHVPEGSTRTYTVPDY
jgi:hypothetical protein